MDKGRVLVVDDDEVYLRVLSERFSKAGWSCTCVQDLVAARRCVQNSAPTHAVVDLHLVNEFGLDLLPEVVKAGARVVVLTGYGSVPTALEAVRLGAINFLAKPVGFQDLEAALLGPALKPVAGASEVSVPSLDDVAWEHIQRVLRDCGGNITRAAKQLGIHRQALQRKLKSPPMLR